MKIERDIYTSANKNFLKIKEVFFMKLESENYVKTEKPRNNTEQ